MLRRAFARVSVAGVAVAAVVGLVAAPAWAPKYILGASAFGECHLPDGSVSRFEGAFTVLSFSSAGGTLYVTGSVAGSCIDGLDVVATVPGAPYTFPVTSVSTACAPDDALVHVRPGATLVGGVTGPTPKDGEAVKMTLDLFRTTVERSWTPTDPESLRAKLCAVDRVARVRPLGSLAQVLNALVVRA